MKTSGGEVKVRREAYHHEEKARALMILRGIGSARCMSGIVESRFVRNCMCVCVNHR